VSTTPTVILRRPEADEESRREAVALLDAETLRYAQSDRGYQRMREITARATIKEGYGA